MNIEITPEQNVIVDGVEYVAKPSRGCYGCHFFDIDRSIDCNDFPCNEEDRIDEISQVFIRKV